MIEALLGRIFVFWIRNTLLREKEKKECVCEKAGICFTSSYKFIKIVFRNMMTTTCERGNKRAHFNFMSLGCESQQITTTKKANKKMQTPNVQILLLF